MEPRPEYDYGKNVYEIKGVKRRAPFHGGRGKGGGRSRVLLLLLGRRACFYPPIVTPLDIFETWISSLCHQTYRNVSLLGPRCVPAAAALLPLPLPIPAVLSAPLPHPPAVFCAPLPCHPPPLPPLYHPPLRAED